MRVAEVECVGMLWYYSGYWTGTAIAPPDPRSTRTPMRSSRVRGAVRWAGSAPRTVTAVAADRMGWETTAFHLGPETCDVELAVTSIVPADAARLEEEVAAEIRAARPVKTRRVRPEEMGGLPVRTRGLPEGHSGDVRLVEIEGGGVAEGIRAALKSLARP